MKKIILIVSAFVILYVISGLFYLSDIGQLSFDPNTSEASRWQYGYGEDDDAPVFDSKPFLVGDTVRGRIYAPLRWFRASAVFTETSVNGIKYGSDAQKTIDSNK